MAFRPPKKQPEFADLQGILAQTRDTENSLYQTVQVLIDRLTQFRLLNEEQLASKLNEADGDKRFATKFATFITKNDETSRLPGSIQLLAGSGVFLDYSVANQLTLNAGGYAPMSTGAEPLEIMSDGAGSVLMVGFSE